MADNTFELLTKIYSEFTDYRKETNQRFDNLENKFTNLETGQHTLQNSQRKIEAMIENDIKNNIDALYDGYMQVYEKLETLDTKVDTINQKLDMHDVEIRVIKGGK